MDPDLAVERHPWQGRKGGAEARIDSKQGAGAVGHRGPASLVQGQVSEHDMYHALYLFMYYVYVY